MRSLYGNLCRGASGVLLSASEKADGRRKALFQGTGNADGADDSADWDRRTGQLSRLLGKQSADACAFGQSGGGGCRAVVPGFLLLAVNFDPVQGNKQPIYEHTTELLLLLLLSAGLGFGLWLGLPLAGVLAVASVLGEIFLWGGFVWLLLKKSLWQETASVLANFFGGGVSGSVYDRRLDAVKKELRQRALAARNALEKREEKKQTDCGAYSGECGISEYRADFYLCEHGL